MTIRNKRRIYRAWCGTALALGLAMVSGCANGPAVDGAAGSALATGATAPAAQQPKLASGTGRVFFRVNLKNKECGSVHAKLATADAEGNLSVVKTASRVSFFGRSPHDALSAELPSGTYHLVHFQCHASRVHGASAPLEFKGFLLTETQKWEGSLAQFDVIAGETVDLGQIDLKLIGLQATPKGASVMGRYAATFAPATPEQRNWVLSNHKMADAALISRSPRAGLRKSGILNVPGCGPRARPKDPKEAAVRELLCRKSWPVGANMKSLLQSQI